MGSGWGKWVGGDGVRREWVGREGRVGRRMDGRRGGWV